MSCVGMVILRHKGDGSAALCIVRSEVTTTEDDYTNRTTSTIDYKLRTCCVATVKSRKRVVELWLAAMLPSGPNQGLQIIANFSFNVGIAEVS